MSATAREEDGAKPRGERRRRALDRRRRGDADGATELVGRDGRRARCADAEKYAPCAAQRKPAATPPTAPPTQEIA